MTSAPPSIADPAIDVRSYLRLIWSRRVVIVLVTMATIAAAVIAHVAEDKRYVATARLYLGQPSGSPAASEATARYRVFLMDAAVSGQVFKQLGLDAPPYSMTEAGFRESLSMRPAEASTLLLEVRLTDRSIAVRAAEVLARRLVEVARSQEQTVFKIAQDLQRTELEEADRNLGDARRAVAEFRMKHFNSGDLSAQDRAGLQRMLNEVQTDIPAARARLQSVQQLLSQTPAVVSLKREPAGAEADKLKAAGLEPQLFVAETVNRLHTSLAQQVAHERGLLSGLEAKRDYLRAVLAGGQSPAQVEAESQLTELQADLLHVQRQRDQLGEASLALRRDRATAKPGLQFLDQGVEAASPTGSSLRTVLTRGFLIGLLLSIVGVILTRVLKF